MCRGGLSLRKIVTVGFGLCFRLVAWEWFDKAKVLLLKFAGYFWQWSLDLVISLHHKGQRVSSWVHSHMGL